MNKAWYLSEVSIIGRTMGEDVYLNVILRNASEGSDCNVTLPLAGKLLGLVNELEAEAISRIRDRLP